jgi:tetratricopeptide (TPR) repeat protein
VSKRLVRVIDVAVAVAGTLKAGDIARLLTNSTKQQLGINRLTEEKLVPDPRRPMPKDLITSGKLLPAYQAIPFNFRNAELDNYLDWCGQSEKLLAVRLITGASGRGKTRLMVELAGRLRDEGPVLPGRTKPEWVSGFIDISALEHAASGGTGDPYGVPFAANRDLCIIIDYAENRPDEVTKLLKAAVAAIDDGHERVIRIILIARQPSEIFQTILQDSELADRASVDFRDFPLEPIADPNAFFQLACKALEVPEVGRVYPSGLNSERPDCGILSLAALLAATDKAAVIGGETEILDKVLNHEKRYWQGAAQRNSVPGVLLEQKAHEIVAANLTFYGLQGAIPDIAAGVDMIGKIPLLADQPRIVLHALVRTVADLYPHPDGRIEGVGLDLLGDRFVVARSNFLAELNPNDDQVHSALTRATWVARRNPEQGRALLNKLLAYNSERRLALVLHMAPAIGDPLGQLASEWLEQHPLRSDEAQHLEQTLPAHSLTLRELALAITRNALLDRDTLSEDRQAQVLNNLANRLSDLGQRKAALDAAKEAVDLRRKLAQARTDAFTPDLAGSLNNLAVRLSDLGQHEAALEAAKEAVDIYRQLAQARPDAFTPNLAGTLNTLANRLSDLGQHEAALDAAKEAIELQRKLAQAKARPDAFTPDLARSLHTLANRLFGLGQHEAALDAAQEAIELQRKLAQARPDAFTPNLAGSLNSLVSFLSNLGLHEAALDAAKETMDLYRKLAQARPNAFTPDLAGCLNNLANTLFNLGQPKAALEAAKEAVDIYRQLAKARPDAFTPNLAGTLNTLANGLSDLGQHEAALETAEEAVDLYRKLAQARPDAFTPDLAMSLGAYSQILIAHGETPQAVTALHEAISLLTRQFLNSNVAFRDLMGALRQSYAQACEASKQEPDMKIMSPIDVVFKQLQNGTA